MANRRGAGEEHDQRRRLLESTASTRGVTIGCVLGEDGRYKVLDILSFSATSSVWLVKDRTTGKKAVLKVLDASKPSHSALASNEVAVLNTLERRYLSARTSPTDSPNLKDSSKTGFRSSSGTSSQTRNSPSDFKGHSASHSPFVQLLGSFREHAWTPKQPSKPATKGGGQGSGGGPRARDSATRNATRSASSSDCYSTGGSDRMLTCMVLERLGESVKQLLHRSRTTRQPGHASQHGHSSSSGQLGHTWTRGLSQIWNRDKGGNKCTATGAPKGLPLSAVQNMTRESLLALSFMHGLGLVHLDIKPGNILAAAHVATSEAGKKLDVAQQQPVHVQSVSGIFGPKATLELVEAGRTRGRTTDSGLRWGSTTGEPVVSALAFDRLRHFMPNDPPKRTEPSLGLAYNQPRPAGLDSGPAPRQAKPPGDTLAPQNAKPPGDTLALSIRLCNPGPSAQQQEAFPVYRTLAYTPPELLLELPVTPAADIWSLACVTYEAAAGEKLFDMQQVQERMDRGRRREMEFAPAGRGPKGGRAKSALRGVARTGSAARVHEEDGEATEYEDYVMLDVIQETLGGTLPQSMIDGEAHSAMRNSQASATSLAPTGQGWGSQKTQAVQASTGSQAAQTTQAGAASLAPTGQGRGCQTMQLLLQEKLHQQGLPHEEVVYVHVLFHVG
eukprot:gene16716-22985_t